MEIAFKHRVTLYLLTWAAYALTLAIAFGPARWDQENWMELAKEAPTMLAMLPYLLAVGLMVLAAPAEWSLGIFGLAIVLMVVHAILTAVNDSRKTITRLWICQVTASVASLYGLVPLIFELD
jgi:hypothetical protein